jgi:hypothetical protein
MNERKFLIKLLKYTSLILNFLDYTYFLTQLLD